MRKKNGAYPAATSIDELERALVPSVDSGILTKDTWDTQLRYVPSADRKSYKLVSAGADGVFDERSWNERVKLATANDDAVIENGKFIRKWDDDTRPGDTRKIRARHRFPRHGIDRARTLRRGDGRNAVSRRAGDVRVGERRAGLVSGR